MKLLTKKDFFSNALSCSRGDTSWADRLWLTDNNHMLTSLITPIVSVQGQETLTKATQTQIHRWTAHDDYDSSFCTCCSVGSHREGWCGFYWGWHSFIKVWNKAVYQWLFYADEHHHDHAMSKYFRGQAHMFLFSFKPSWIVTIINSDWGLFYRDCTVWALCNHWTFIAKSSKDLNS